MKLEQMAGLRFVASYSGGKDSALAVYRAVCAGMKLQALLVTYNEEQSRSWFHGIPDEILGELEKAIGVPVIRVKTADGYNEAFEEALRAQQAQGAQVCVFGDIDITDHKEWGKARCRAAGLTACYPLWGESRESLVQECVASGFVPRITVVDEKKLSASFLGRPLTPRVVREIARAGADVCGETGEYHTFVAEGPLFTAPIPVMFGALLRQGDYAVLPLVRRKTAPGLEKGYVQVYTGNGKGKTTAALGLLLRAAGAGLTCYFGQFMKHGETGECRALRAFAGQITVEQYGSGGEIHHPNREADSAAARRGLNRAQKALLSGQYGLVVLDEVNMASGLGFISEEALCALIEEKPRNTELVFTGRGAAASIIERADLVTEMKETRHYYSAGAAARRGIEW